MEIPEEIRQRMPRRHLSALTLQLERMLMDAEEGDMDGVCDAASDYCRAYQRFVHSDTEIPFEVFDFWENIYAIKFNEAIQNGYDNSRYSGGA